MMDFAQLKLELGAALGAGMLFRWQGRRIVTL
jgi:hypothetical protein